MEVRLVVSQYFDIAIILKKLKVRRKKSFIGKQKGNRMV